MMATSASGIAALGIELIADEFNVQQLNIYMVAVQNMGQQR